jgi:hypothetical protein
MFDLLDAPSKPLSGFSQLPRADTQRHPRRVAAGHRPCTNSASRHVDRTSRKASAAALANRPIANDTVAVCSLPQTSQIIGPRMECQVFPPFGHGVNLAALRAK